MQTVGLENCISVIGVWGEIDSTSTPVSFEGDSQDAGYLWTKVIVSSATDQAAPSEIVIHNRKSELIFIEY